MAWIKASERRPTKADSVDGVVLWREIGKWKIQATGWAAMWWPKDENMEWHPIIVPDDSEPAQKPELPQPGQVIWVRDYDGDSWVKRLFSRFGKVALCNAEGKTELEWLQWSLTDPNKPPEPQYRPFENDEEFWPFAGLFARMKEKGTAYRISDFSTSGCTVASYYRNWSRCFECLELLEDIDGKMVARPFGVLVEPETNIS